MFPNKKDMTFGRFFPQTWKIIAAEKEGQFISKEGLFTFTTVPPIGIKAFRFVPREARLLETRLAASSRAGHCKVIHHIPQEELVGLVGLSFRRLCFLFGAMALAAVLIAWFTAQVMTARKRVQKELRIKESAIQSSINAIVMTDLEGRITYVNHAALDMFGYEETDEILGRFAAEYFIDSGLGLKILGKIKRESSWLGETVVSRKDGAEITVRIAASPVKDENGRPYRLMASMVDISEQKKAEAMLMFQARHDALTGLYNRRYLMERLETEMGAAKRHGFPLAVCLCDLDHFKAVNDTYGHRTGDEVLAGFGRLIAAEIRAQDTAGRYGGEEFCIVFPYISASAAKISLERIRTLWKKTAFEVEDGRNFWVTASFGLAELEGPDMSPNDLLEKADQALYRAKESGRNRVVGP